jgi:hypothetical protein
MNINAYLSRLFFPRIPCLAVILGLSLLPGMKSQIIAQSDSRAAALQQSQNAISFQVPGAPDSRRFNEGMNFGMPPFGLCQRLPAVLQ